MLKKLRKKRHNRALHAAARKNSASR